MQQNKRGKRIRRRKKKLPIINPASVSRRLLGRTDNKQAHGGLVNSFWLPAYLSTYLYLETYLQATTAACLC
ncbi:hypothetical protein IF2G_00652 [Cordyceps javanica]|nr:hypothetical protein IF2G_00652 [Cordyceps javanica]